MLLVALNPPIMDKLVSGKINPVITITRLPGITPTARPTYKATSFGGRPTLHFNGKYMTVSNSASGFDNWDKMTIFAVVDEQSANSWSWWFSGPDI